MNDSIQFKNTRPKIRSAVAGLFWLLLAGFLIFNKPFALLGIPPGVGHPPLYIGEMVLACVLLVTFENWRRAIVQPFKDSWAVRCIAAFFIYGVSRAILDFPARGWWAFRDGVCAGYALVAFLAPTLWCGAGWWNRKGARILLGGNESGQIEARSTLSPEDLPSHLVRMLLPLSACAAAWSAALRFNIIRAPAENKVDFLTMSAAIAAWVWTMATVKATRIKTPGSDQTTSHLPWILFAAALSAAAFLTMIALPTRAVWLSVGPLTLAVVLTLTRRPRVVLWCAGLLCAALILLSLGRMSGFVQVDVEWELDRGLDVSIDRLEAKLRENPEVLPKFVFDADTSGGDLLAKAERLTSLLSLSDTKSKTDQGRIAQAAVKWRAAFWLRCCRYAFHQAPLFGIGFGNNLTNLLRGTPAWPLFIPSMAVGNRSPHSAHVTIFTRLGLCGLFIWGALIFCLFKQAICACRTYLKLAGSALTPEIAARNYRRFWDTLTILGVWIVYLCSMSFGVVLEGPMGGIWFWALTGVLALINPYGDADEVALNGLM